MLEFWSKLVIVLWYCDRYTIMMSLYSKKYIIYAAMLLLGYDPLDRSFKLNDVYGDDTLYTRMKIMNMFENQKLTLMTWERTLNFLVAYWISLVKFKFEPWSTKNINESIFFFWSIVKNTLLFSRKKCYKNFPLKLSLPSRCQATAVCRTKHLKLLSIRLYNISDKNYYCFHVIVQDTRKAATMVTSTIIIIDPGPTTT